MKNDDFNENEEVGSRALAGGDHSDAPEKFSGHKGKCQLNKEIAFLIKKTG